MSNGDKDVAAVGDPRRVRSVRIFTYPKIIFIWPTLVASLICGIGMLLIKDETRAPTRIAEQEVALQAPAAADAPADADLDAEPAPSPRRLRNFTSLQNMLGLFFLGIFALNMLVMSLDFPRFTIIAGVLLVLFVTFLLLWIGVYYDIVTPLAILAENIYTVANAGFYFSVAVILGLMFTVIALTRYLDYWEIRPNEILHHHGPLSDLERFPTINLRFTKEIPDVMEFLLGLGSGRLVLKIGSEQRAIILDNVLFINQKEEALKQLMSQLRVDVGQQGGRPEEPF